MQLRGYQQDAVDSFFADAQKHPRDAQLIAMPTGTGKSLVIAEVCRRAADAGLRILVLHRSKELVAQNRERYTQVDPQGEARAGCYAASMGIRDTEDQVIFASVQSIFKRGSEFGVRQLVICDESHQIPQESESQYQTLLKELRRTFPASKLLGLTATPYRMKGGVIHGGKGAMFDRLSYNAPLGEMFDSGYLTRPITLDVATVDLSGVKVVRGDYEKAAMQNAFLGRSITGEIVAASNAQALKSVLVFTSGVSHAELIKEELGQLGERVEVITGMTLPLVRSEILHQFSVGRVRFLVNVDVLTTGFDCSRIDGVVIARGTQSPGLFMQMVGRGTRLHEGKLACMVMDYGGNIALHGPVDSSTYGIDTIKDPTTGDGTPPQRVCPSCFEVQPAQNRKCQKCGLDFPIREKDLVTTSESITIVQTDHVVKETTYKRWKGKELDDGTKKQDTLVVQYKLIVNDDDDLTARKRYAREWLCVEHSGFSQKKFAQWWAKRSEYAVPETITEALKIIDSGGVAATMTLSLKKDGKYDRVTGTTCDHIPKSQELDFDYDNQGLDSSVEDCPF